MNSGVVRMNMKQDDMFDLTESRRLRDVGIKQTQDDAEDWNDAARDAFDRFAATGVSQFITEDFRRWWQEHGGYQEPRSPHAWGAFTNALARAERIRAAGCVRAAASVKSHARKMLVWQILRTDEPSGTA